MILHADQYSGCWAMYQPAFNALRSFYESLDLNVHLDQVADPKSDVSISVVARDKVKANAQTFGDTGVQAVEVATVELSGPLMKHIASGSNGSSTVRARRAIRALANDDSIDAVMIQIDSPGGTVAGTADLADDIAALAARKPTHAYIADCGCSAAYWLASAASRISANATAVVGSIGVYSVVHDLSEYAADKKIKTHVLRTGEYKGAGAPGSEITESQLAEFQKLVDGYHADFKQQIATGRNMAAGAVDALADGRVWKGQAAVDVGLADGVSSIDDAYSALVAEVAESRKQKGGRMAAKKDEVATEATEPKAATIKEMKADSLLANAPADFLVEQAGAEATLADAKDAYATKIAKENADLKAAADERAEADKKARAEAAKNPGRGGAKPLGDSGDAVEADAADDYESAVKANIDAGMTSRDARRMAAKKNPEAWKAFQSKAPLSRDTIGEAANIPA